MKDKDNLSKLRHSTSHLLAAAVLKLWPHALPAIGPSTEEGFFYDFDFGNTKINESDFPKIEKEMRKIISSWKEFRIQQVSKKEALKIFSGNPYKNELIDDFVKEKKKITIVKSGDFIDLCKGGHIKNPDKKIKYFKLLKIAGSYWKGDEKNKMLTRIYGTAFFKKEDLEEYIKNQKEGQKRDHRKLGPRLGIFIISKEIGKGLPLLTPKGTTIRNIILDYERKLNKEFGFEEVWTPHIAKVDIYKKTGHWQHYRESMFSSFGIEGEKYVLKPMNCPHHYAIYSSKERSYKDLPIRLAEPGTVYRYEKSGEVGGLTRVRAITIDDAHILMRNDQIEEEFDRCIKMVTKMLKILGLESFYIRLSLADPNDQIKYIADEKTWQKASRVLEKIVKKNSMEYKKVEGEASFYGPKIDFIVNDALKREWQLSTLQLDLFMAKRLGLYYIDKNGRKKNPAILHRGLTGSIERTIGILIEHYNGYFPLWLSPLQIRILPLSDRFNDYALKIADILSKNDFRVDTDLRNKTLGARVRDAEIQRIPYILVVGEKEKRESTVSLREANAKKYTQLKIDKLIQMLQKKCKIS